VVLRRLPGDLLVAEGRRRPAGIPHEGLHAADGVRAAGENSEAASRKGNGLAQIAGEPTKDFLLVCQGVGPEIDGGPTEIEDDAHRAPPGRGYAPRVVDLLADTPRVFSGWNRLKEGGVEVRPTTNKLHRFSISGSEPVLGAQYRLAQR
jgi:hypothetical protein